MENNNSNQDSFWQFSDQLRLQSASLSNLSLNDNIWGGNSFTSKRPEERRNFDIRVGGERNLNFPQKQQQIINGSELNGFNNGWKIENSIGGVVGGVQKNVNLNGGFNKGVYSKHGINQMNNYSINTKNKEIDVDGKFGKKYANNSNTNQNNKSNQKQNTVDKRFKTLPASESLPRHEHVGGYIFVCNNDTMQENLKRELFGLPPRYRDSVRQITPGLPLFLYNYSTHQLHGIFEASSFGGTNIDPTAWEDKKCPGESRFPAQVKVSTRKICEPLEEDAFRPILHHYDGPKFRLELNIPEALSLLDVFVDKSIMDVFEEKNN